VVVDPDCVVASDPFVTPIENISTEPAFGDDLQSNSTFWIIVGSVMMLVMIGGGIGGYFCYKNKKQANMIEHRESLPNRKLSIKRSGGNVEVHQEIPNNHHPTDAEDYDMESNRNE